jgi:transposase-like protein
MTQPLPNIEKPRSLLDFVRMFPTDEPCAKYLLRIRHPNGFVCPKCGSQKGWPIAGRSVIECNKGHQISLKSGTVMHRSRQSLTTWFYAAYLMSTLTPGISALQFQKQLGIKRYETAFNMLHKLRSALVAPEREKLKGEVEVDECYIGGPAKGKPGRSKGEKALVVTAAEIVRWIDTSGRKPCRHVTQYDIEGPPERQERSNADGEPVLHKRAGRVRMSVVPDASAETLLPWIQANIEKGAKVYTDGWQGYNDIEALGFSHIRTLQVHNGHKTGSWLPLVHLLISNMKRWLTGTHKGAVLHKHLQAYLNEFSFRFNRRFWRGPAFLRALGLAVNVDRWPRYDTLYSGEWAHPDSEKFIPEITG